QCRRASGLRNSDHPAHSGPLAEQLAETVREVARRPLGGAELDAAGLKPDQVDIRDQMRTQQHLPPSLEQRDDFVEALRRRVEFGPGGRLRLCFGLRGGVSRRETLSRALGEGGSTWKRRAG